MATFWISMRNATTLGETWGREICIRDYKVADRGRGRNQEDMTEWKPGALAMLKGRERSINIRSNNINYVLEDSN